MVRHPPSSRPLAMRIAGSGISILAVSVVALMANVAPAEAAEPDPTPVPVAVLPVAADPAAEVDNEAVAEAAEDFTSGNAGDVARLAEAAATEDAVPVERTLGGMVAETAAGTVAVSRDGEATISAEGMPTIGVAVAGDAESVRIVNGAVVQTEVAPSTDIVTRATDAGMQMIAVLGDESAPNAIEFPLDLPEGSKLVPQADGSIAVVGEAQLNEPLAGEEERIDAEIESILGTETLSDDLAELTDEQWAALEAIAPAETHEVVQTVQVATIGAPWAVDANGESLSTHYEITDDGIAQVIETDEDTAFPVTVDPERWWWVGTALTCAADLASFLFAGAKLLKAVTKINKLTKKSATLTKIVQKLGGAKETLKAIYNFIKGFIEGKVGKYLSSTKRLLLASLSSTMLNWIGDALGIGSCVSIVKEFL